MSVVVVGAGPAGSATALGLARAGVDVTIVERSAFPRRKVCGEYLAAGALDALDRLGIGAAARAAGAALRGARVVAPGVPPFALPFPRPALGVPRAVLDALLLEAAQAAGAEVVRARVEDLALDDDGGTLTLRDAEGAPRTLRAGLVVGADGIGSLVARRAGLARSARRAGRFAVGGHYGGGAELAGLVELTVESGAYLARNPLRDRVNVLSVGTRESVAARSAAVDGRVAGARLGPRVAVGPLAQQVAAAARGRVVLVGDAAGFLDPFTGQGVFLALTGGERAAEAILAALARPAGASSALAGYGRWRAAELRRRARLCGLVARIVATPPLARRVGARLPRLPDAAATLLEALAGTRSPVLPLPLVARLVL